MAFVVEDGTGLEDANSLVSLEYAEQFHVDNGTDSEWLAIGGGDTTRQIYLVQATQYLNKYKFKGWPTSPFQNCAFPRSYNLANEMPKCVKDAVCLLAYLIVTQEGLYEDTVDDLNIKSKSSELPGGLSSSVSYTESKQPTTHKTFGQVESLLAKWIETGKVFGVSR